MVGIARTLPAPSWARRRAALLGGLLALGLAALLGAELWLLAVGRWLAAPSRPAPAEVIVVLGGGYDRMRYGAELRERGYAPELWQTGRAWDGEAILAIRDERGWDPASVAFLPATSTWEDAAAIVAHAERHGTRRILLVTSWYHSRRARCLLQHHLAGRDLAVAFAAPPGAGPEGWWRDPVARRDVAGELVKLAGYGLLYGVSPLGCEG